MNLNKSAKNALWLGSLCATSYLAVYIARNILSAVTPQMIENGEFTKEYIGTVSSLFFAFYALGQLLNGIIGDKIKARYMMCLGMLFSGISTFIFPYIITIPKVATLLYGLVGFFLSMIYAPMTKVIAENIELPYSTRCSLSYSLTAYLGSPFAGIIATFFVWKTSFFISSIFLFIMAILCFTFFLIFEKNGIIKFNQHKPEKSDKCFIKSIPLQVKALVKRRIIVFSIISILTGIVRTTVVFWLPTYISQYLEFSASVSTTIFTVATSAIVLSVFLATIIYRLLNQNMDTTIILLFAMSAMCFLGAYFFSLPVINIIFIVLAIISSNAAATMLWSYYCPSLKDTGIVSTATGFLTFIGYIGSSISSPLFATASTSIGWKNLILIWCALMVIGAFVTVPYYKLKK